MAKIGLVAGQGDLPLVFARNAKAKGETVIGFGIKGITDEAITAHVDKMHWLAWGGLQKAIMLAMLDGVKRVVLLGKISKTLSFTQDAAMDEDARKVLSGKAGRRDYGILREVEGLLQKIGISIIDPTPFLGELIPSPGQVSGRSPTEKEWADIRYAAELAKFAARYDIGQTIAVKDKTVIAVEAVEGTDETLARAGALTGGGFVAVKMARPDQDMRFDVPLVGVATLRALIAARGTALALEAGKMYLADRNELVTLAATHNIAIVVL